MTYVEYKQLNPFQRFAHNFKKFILNIPHALAKFFKAIGHAIVRFFTGIGKGFKNYGVTFVKGDWATKLSYLIFGIGDIHKGKYYKGILFFLTEVLYALYMIFFGWTYLQKFNTLGTVATTQGFNELGMPVTVYGDNSMLILLYSVLSIVITILVFAVYISNIKDAYRHQVMRAEGKKPTSLKHDVKEFLDGKYHITLLSFPTLMIGIFNIMPMIFMILIAFTSYDQQHLPPGTLFTWVGFDNFASLFNFVDSATKATTFIELTKWTLIWAVVATFTNYILGMVVALMINKKGIKFKALWRTLFVIAIAVPQFVSLLLMNQMLQTNGAINIILSYFNGGVNPQIQFLNSSTLMARMTVIIVNLWVGIPYTILSMSGILMNIPEDLYESARIDGAGPVKTFTKITLPYMIFVTTPQLITQFVGNINNFNVIYLLTGGGPSTEQFYQAGRTDILVTWLFNLTMGSQDYGLAAAIGILVFIVCATLSLLIYNNSKSMKDEEAFS
ncbi:carbohydrate ABC transporter permease [Ruminococcus sp.]|jgi:arabinogalactan oligomer/maltooligosaccharide transport system permease protein|uniref:carbohydrate ABC transporter permease n=1 Tax=Ruminococcus sp. TaxID=41978 RepID=UPI0025F19292|nr:sugar ABC transporter permease [Ruminococcus sp.]MCI2113546.1 sugar ABC transporter permease [Ruminococcus sp.]MDD6988809.1 sugar ABC transporter permease [Ruminococcus sp.]MDY6200851.1 sugar ABC transporter permease [Ruminococcus sp.]